MSYENYTIGELCIFIETKNVDLLKKICEGTIWSCSKGTYGFNFIKCKEVFDGNYTRHIQDLEKIFAKMKENNISLRDYDEEVACRFIVTRCSEDVACYCEVYPDLSLKFKVANFKDNTMREYTSTEEYQNSH